MLLYSAEVSVFMSKSENAGALSFFGKNVFGIDKMKERLPEATFESLLKTIKEGTPLDAPVAQDVANAMKNWAVERGATHFTHWFQPMTGITAEKHDAFITPGKDGKAILEFSGSELIKGESDASSFPSAGLRATFEARGYTAWDPTSPAFVKDDTLYIPTAFCSHSGEALDKKTPLLRSMAALNRSAVRLLKHFDPEIRSVVPTAGAEQEYFLVDRKYFERRKDLIFTGRTLFGAKPPKGQELDDHYFGNIESRVSAYMKELDHELWKLGVFARTKHNEGAPAQHELAPVYTDCNIASDHNQLTMELMKKIAEKHDLVCLLHEKPFEGVNGSGKHDNWSLMTDSGENLLKPGKNPSSNKRFLLILVAIIEAVDRYGDLLRMCVASSSNDCRLGGYEAPPSIISMYIGNDLSEVLEDFAKGEEHKTTYSTLDTGVAVLPLLYKDNNDRNRTSPFSFTGNKFEFRMPGASQSISGVNIVLNTIAAEVFSEYADMLDAGETVDNIISKQYKAHKKIVFNGNNYCDEWIEEAARRGLPNARSTVDALEAYTSDKAIALFEKHGVFTSAEVHARKEIKYSAYNKTVLIEAKTMLEMARREILPAGIAWAERLFTLRQMRNYGLGAETKLANDVSELNDRIYDACDSLESAIDGASGIKDRYEKAVYMHDVVLAKMKLLRDISDKLETVTPSEYWPMPTYTDLMFKL